MGARQFSREAESVEPAAERMPIDSKYKAASAGPRSGYLKACRSKPLARPLSRRCYLSKGSRYAPSPPVIFSSIER
jgi:hypothetical protein